MSSIASVIVNQLDAAQGDVSGLTTSTLAELGVVLIAITLVTNIAARAMVHRASAATALPVGRGI